MHTLIGPEPALGMAYLQRLDSTEMRDWTSKKTREALAVHSWINAAKGFLKRLPAKINGKLLSMSRNQLKIMRGLLKGHCHLSGHLFRLGLANSLGCDRSKQAYEMASHILCDCEALTALRFKHLGQHFLKAGDTDISVSTVLQFVLRRGC